MIGKIKKFYVDYKEDRIRKRIANQKYLIFGLGFLTGKIERQIKLAVQDSEERDKIKIGLEGYRRIYSSVSEVDRLNKNAEINDNELKEVEKRLSTRLSDYNTKLSELEGVLNSQ